MATKAQIKASAKYSRSNTKRYAIELNKKNDIDLIEWLDGLENKQGTIKKIIREYMEKGKK